MTKLKTSKLPDPMKPKGTLKKLENKLFSEGYFRIGSGAFATAYAKDDHVIKVAKNDVGYDTWLSIVLANQDNPFMPKIYDVKRFADVKVDRNSEFKYDVTVVSMERLHKDYSEFGRQNVGERLSWSRKSYQPKDVHEKQLVAILNKLEKERGRLDIGSSNVLFRGKQPVFTDPVA